MAYKMRFRVLIKTVGQGAAEEPEAADATAVTIGDYADPPTSRVLSLNTATGVAVSFLNRFQRGAMVNVRAEIYGQPVGAPEDGNPDISEASKEERLYAHIDAPNPRLLYEIYLANRKVSTSAAYVPPADVIPEVEELA